MTHRERLEEIVQKEQLDEVIPLFKTLDAKERKAFANELSHFNFYWEFVTYEEKGPETSSITYSSKPKGTDNQKKILAVAHFFCDNLKNFQNNWARPRFIDKKLLDEILPIYCPTWFNDFINDFDKSGWTKYNLDYIELADLAAKGYCTLSPELVVRKLPDAVFPYEKSLWNFTPEVLTRFPDTLNKHLWYFFEYESSIHLSGNYYRFQNPNQDNSWKAAIRIHADAGLIDRKRLLKESLLATNRNFNKVLSGWFIDVFDRLEPTAEELLELQDDLLGILASPNSKVVNTSLNCLKQLAKNKKLDESAFLDQAVILLTSETKATVSSVLTTLDNIGKNKGITEQVCRTACHAFYQQDNDLQVKAAKVVARYSKGFEDAIKEDLKVYRDTLLSEAKGMLAGMIDTEEVNIETDAPKTLEPSKIGDNVDDLNKLPEIKKFDDLLFLASQAFDNNETFHFDLFPAALVDLQQEITGANLAKFEPVLQRALKTVTNEWSSQMGYLDHMLAIFFIEYANFLCARYPADTKSLMAIRRAVDEKEHKLKQEFPSYSNRIIKLETWDTQQSSPVYLLFRDLLIVALTKLRDQDGTPMLSAPTHYPCWLDPAVLVERLRKYQEKKLPVYDTDLQVALARCYLRDKRTLNKIGENLNGELKEIMCFLLDENQKPIGPFTNEPCWFTAGVTRSPDVEFEEFQDFSCNNINRSYYTGRFEWNIEIEDFKTSRYDPQKRDIIEVAESRTIMRMTREPRFKPEPKKGFFSFLKKKSKETITPSIYADQVLKAGWGTSTEQNDIARILSMIPNNPGPMLATVMGQAMRYPTPMTEGEKRLLIKSLQQLALFYHAPTPMVCDFLGASMISGESEARKIAGEIWLAGVTKGVMDNEGVGRAIGKMNEREFMPLKRFTDLAAGLFNISTAHRKAMHEVVAACIESMPDVPVRNTKNLLTILAETKSKDAVLSYSPGFRRKMKLWKETKALSQLVGKFEPD